MEKIYVVGYIKNKKWSPIFPEDKSQYENIKCRKGTLEKQTITIFKEQSQIAANSCFYAKSAVKAKQKYIDTQATPKTLHAIAYTDGSYNSEIGRYGYGVCLIIDEKEFEYFGGDKDTEGGWQVVGELQAVLIAVEKAIEANCSSIKVCYDYEGVHAWADGLWRTNKSYTADYKRKIQEYRKQIGISFTHVKSHTGDKNNECADKLAKKGAKLEYTQRRKTVELSHRIIGEFVNPECRQAIQVFWEKRNPAFKDFMALKTGGMDAYSRMQTGDLLNCIHGIDLAAVSAELPDMKNQLAAIRWIARGLSVDDAIHKIKVDMEVNENAIKRKFK